MKWYDANKMQYVLISSCNLWTLSSTQYSCCIIPLLFLNTFGKCIKCLVSWLKDYDIVYDMFWFRYGWSTILDKPSHAGGDGGWRDTDPQEIYNFTALLIYMGFVKLPTIPHYWSTKSLGGSWARRFLSRKRFQALLSMLHVVDPTQEKKDDKLTKLRYIIDHFKKVCKELFQVRRDTSPQLIWLQILLNCVYCYNCMKEI